MAHKKRPRKTPQKGSVRNPETGPVVKHPNPPGESPSPWGPAFGQSVEAGGID